MFKRYQLIATLFVVSVSSVHGLIDKPASYFAGKPVAIAGHSSCSLNKDIALVKRIADAYSLTVSEQLSLGSSMWGFFFVQRHQNTHEILLRGDLESAAAILQNPQTTDLFYGFDNFFQEVHNAIQNNLDAYAEQILVELIQIAEAIGAIRAYNPEAQDHSYRKIPQSIDQLLELLDEKFEQPLKFPNIFEGETGLLTSRGVVTPRDTQAIYQAIRIKELLEHIPNPRVLEIGAGLGRTAYYARQLGILDYTIIDIPFTSVSSGYFLIQTVGADNVILYGEESLDASKCVKIFPPTYFFNTNESFDLIINADSLTEIVPDTARAYLDKIGSTAGIFLSFNHEVNPFTVHELIRQDTRKLFSIRSPYWMRAGYLEEIVRYR